MLLSLSPNIENLSAKNKKIIDLVRGIKLEKLEEEPSIGPIESLGRFSFWFARETVAMLSFVGEFMANLVGTFFMPLKFRLTSCFNHIVKTGINAVPIIFLIAFLIAVVLTYQGSIQLKKFGADIYTVDLVVISVLREMSALLVAIMVAGRSGSAFAAEIGVMKVNEEVDAMRTIGLNPFEVIVLPRAIALILVLPLLTFIADIAGILGGAVAVKGLLGISYDQYFARVESFVSIKHFWVGIIKAPFFGAIIAIIGCLRGLQVSGSSESVGKLTTQAVVESIFLVIVADAIFSILFVKIGI